MDDNNNRGNSFAPENDLLLINHCYPNSNQDMSCCDNKKTEYVIIYLLCS